MAQLVTAEAPVDTSHLPELFHRLRANAPQVGQTSARERIAKLTKIKEAVESNLPEIQAALMADFGKPPEEVTLTEVFPLLSEIKHIRKNLKQWMAPRIIPASMAFLGASCEVRCQPRGVVLIISPWNYPFQLALGPLVAAIAAGNCAVVKPSEFCPHTSALVAAMVKNIFSESEVAIVEGEKEVAQALLQLPFDHIFFTGSPAVGRLVMAAAAKNLTSVTLELGGKSPVIIDRSARLSHAAERIAWGKFINAGQTCVAPDYVLVPSQLAPQLVESLKHEIERLYQGAAESIRNPDYCRLIHDRHLERLEKMLHDSTKAGAQVAIGGQVDRDARKIAPTVLTGVTPDNPIMREEIFGPILPILEYQDLDEALDVVNALPHALALYVFSRDQGQAERVLAETKAGDSVVNDVVVHFSNSALPFGGVGESGIGKAHGVYGFEEFSHLRSVLKQPRFTATALLRPPYDRPWLRRLVKWTIKYFA